MANLKFADTHNMVMFLSKPAESEGFEQIVDFLNANPIRYALTINPTIYTSCIEQFLATVKEKTIDGEGILLESVESREIKIIGGRAWNQEQGWSRTKTEEDSKAIDSTQRKREQLSDASIEIKAYSPRNIRKFEATFNYSITRTKLWFVTAEGMHAVPPPMTGNYMPSGPEIEVDYSQFTYGPKQTQPSESESQSSEFDTCTEDIIDAEDSEKEDESAQDCFVLPIWPSYSSTITPALKTDDKREGPREEEQVFMDELERLKRQEKEANEEAEALRKKFEQETENLVIQAKASSTNLVNTVSIPVSTASPNEGLSLSEPTNPEEDDSEIPPLEDIYQNSTDGIFTTSSYDDEGAVANFTSKIPAHAFVSYVQKQKRNNHKDFQHCLFAYFLSQNEPKKISETLEDESWVDAMQEELLQFKIQKVWVLV
ncbi:hypothetical protein Tco_0588177, partial [Tanacetum coccineum]